MPVNIRNKTNICLEYLLCPFGCDVAHCAGAMCRAIRFILFLYTFYVFIYISALAAVGAQFDFHRLSARISLMLLFGLAIFFLRATFYFLFFFAFYALLTVFSFWPS